MLRLRNIAYIIGDSFWQLSGLHLTSFIILDITRFLFMVCDISHVKSALVNCFLSPWGKSYKVDVIKMRGLTQK